MKDRGKERAGRDGGKGAGCGASREGAESRHVCCGRAKGFPPPRWARGEGRRGVIEVSNETRG